MQKKRSDSEGQFPSEMCSLMDDSMDDSADPASISNLTLDEWQQFYEATGQFRDLAP